MQSSTNAVGREPGQPRDGHGNRWGREEERSEHEEISLIDGSGLLGERSGAAAGKGRRRRRVDEAVDEVNLLGGNQQSGVVLALAEHEESLLATEDVRRRSDTHHEAFHSLRGDRNEAQNQLGDAFRAERIQNEGGDPARSNAEDRVQAGERPSSPFQPLVDSSVMQMSCEGPMEQLSERPRQSKVKRSDQIRQQIMAIEKQTQALNSQKAQLLSMKMGKSTLSTHSRAVSGLESQSQRFEHQHHDGHLLHPDADQSHNQTVVGRGMANHSMAQPLAIEQLEKSYEDSRQMLEPKVLSRSPLEPAERDLRSQKPRTTPRNDEQQDGDRFPQSAQGRSPEQLNTKTGQANNIDRQQRLDDQKKRMIDMLRFNQFEQQIDTPISLPGSTRDGKRSLHHTNLGAVEADLRGTAKSALDVPGYKQHWVGARPLPQTYDIKVSDPITARIVEDQKRMIRQNEELYPAYSLRDSQLDRRYEHDIIQAQPPLQVPQATRPDYEHAQKMSKKRLTLEHQMKSSAASNHRGARKTSEHSASEIFLSKASSGRHAEAKWSRKEPSTAVQYGNPRSPMLNQNHLLASTFSTHNQSVVDPRVQKKQQLPVFVEDEEDSDEYSSEVSSESEVRLDQQEQFEDLQAQKQHWRQASQAQPPPDQSLHRSGTEYKPLYPQQYKQIEMNSPQTLARMTRSTPQLASLEYGLNEREPQQQLDSQTIVNNEGAGAGVASRHQESASATYECRPHPSSKSSVSHKSWTAKHMDTHLQPAYQREGRERYGRRKHEEKAHMLAEPVMLKKGKHKSDMRLKTKRSRPKQVVASGLLEEDNDQFQTAQGLVSLSPHHREATIEEVHQTEPAAPSDEATRQTLQVPRKGTRKSIKQQQNSQLRMNTRNASLSARQARRQKEPIRTSSGSYDSEDLADDMLSAGKISHAKSQQHIHRKYISIDPAHDPDAVANKTHVRRGTKKQRLKHPRYIQFTSDGTKTIFVDQMPSQTRTVFEEFPNNVKVEGPAVTPDGTPEQDSELLRFLQKNQGNDIENGEIVLDEFSCALPLKILIQGKIFISNQALYFFSHFTDSILFFAKSTKFKLPFHQIKQVKKARNAMIFDNSLEITLTNGFELFLTSFINRDQCYKLIKKMYTESISGLKRLELAGGGKQTVVGEARKEELDPAASRGDAKSDERRSGKRADSKNKTAANASSEVNANTSDQSKKRQATSQKNQKTAGPTEADGEAAKATTENKAETKVDKETKSQDKESPTSAPSRVAKSAPQIKPSVTEDAQIEESRKPVVEEVEEPKKDEAAASQPAKVIDVWQGAREINEAFERNDALAKLEEERLKQIKDMIPKYSSGFAWTLYSVVIKGCPLKHLVQNFMYRQNKFSCEGLENETLYEYMLRKQELRDLEYAQEPKKGQENPALKYFMDMDAAVPDPEEVRKNWPLSHEAFQLQFAHCPSSTHPMQPKRTCHKESHADYYASPRKFVRYHCNQGIGFTYCDTFQLHTVITLTQEPGDAPGEFSTRVEIEGQAELLRSVWMITNVIIAQCETQTKRTYKELFAPNFEDAVTATVKQYERDQKGEGADNPEVEAPVEQESKPDQAPPKQDSDQIVERKLDDGAAQPVAPEQPASLAVSNPSELLEKLQKQQEAIEKVSKQVRETRSAFLAEVRSLQFNVQLLLAAFVGVFLLLLLQVAHHSSQLRGLREMQQRNHDAALLNFEQQFNQKFQDLSQSLTERDVHRPNQLTPQHPQSNNQSEEDPVGTPSARPQTRNEDDL